MKDFLYDLKKYDIPGILEEDTEFIPLLSPGR